MKSAIRGLFIRLLCLQDKSQSFVKHTNVYDLRVLLDFLCLSEDVGGGLSLNISYIEEMKRSYQGLQLKQSDYIVLNN
jgi:hypothetical protein